MDEKNDQPPVIRQYRRQAKTIIERHFGKPASRIVYKSSGRTNFVFAVNHVEGQFMVRISPNADNIDAFRKELWASQKAREAGVPSPEVLAVGDDGVSEPYMITRRVTGTEATHHPQRTSIIHEIGRYAATINSIVTTGFGCNFDWTSDGPKHGTWDSYVKEEFELDKRLELLAQHQILPAVELQEIASIIENAPHDGHRDAPTDKGVPQLLHSKIASASAISRHRVLLLQTTGNQELRKIARAESEMSQRRAGG